MAYEECTGHSKGKDFILFSDYIHKKSLFSIKDAQTQNIGKKRINRFFCLTVAAH